MFERVCGKDIRFGQVSFVSLCFFPVWKLAFLLWA